MLMLEENKELLKSDFDLIIDDLVSNETVQKMKNYKQHYDTSCFEHCKNVAYYSYLICRKFNLDYISVARAGMLHDLFLYDWRLRQDGRKGFHAFTHPKTAFKNASTLFTLNNVEKDIILKHMWPLTISLPHYKESFIVSFVDKYCAIYESYKAYEKKPIVRKLYIYEYIFLSLVIIIN